MNNSANTVYDYAMETAYLRQYGGGLGVIQVQGQASDFFGNATGYVLSGAVTLVGDTTIGGNSGPMYTYQAGDTNYETISAGTPVKAGFGYWAYFTGSTPGTVRMMSSSPSCTSRVTRPPRSATSVA